MDVKIENKDTLILCGGEMQYIDSLQELCQRIAIACSVNKGSFPYDRTLGSDTVTFDTNDSRLNEKLSMIFKEATIDIPYTDLRVTKVYEKGGEFYAVLEIVNGVDIITTEVNVSAKLR